MFSPPKTDSVTRTVSSVTLDGRKLSAEVSILLHRAMGRSDAEALATQVAGIVDDILSAQIVQGQVPLTASELEALTLAKAKGLGKVARVRITSLRLSVPPATGYAPSVRPAPTKPPEHRGLSSHESGTRPGPTTPELQRGVRSPSPFPAGPHARAPAPPMQSRPPSPAAPMQSRPPSPAAPMQSRPPSPAAPVPSRPPSPAAPMQSRPPSPAAPVPSRPPSPAAPMQSRPPSPAAPVPSRPPSPSPLPSSAPERVATTQTFGAALAFPLRDAAARAVLSTLSAITPGRVDRWSLLEGTPPLPELCREVCACFAASIYAECVARGESHKLAAAKVEAVCQQAFPDANGPSATEIGFYIAIVAPLSELASRVADLLHCESDQQVLHDALTTCHAEFGERLALLHRRLT